MEKKTSNMVTGMALALLISSALIAIAAIIVIISMSIPELKNQILPKILDKYQMTEGKFFQKTLILLISDFILLLLSVGILKRKNLARKFFLWYLIAYSLWLFVGVIMLHIFKFSTFILWLPLSLFLFYFFTRSQVKEQFK